MNERHLQLLGMAMVFGGLAGVGAAAGIQLAVRVMDAAIPCNAVFSDSGCVSAFEYLNTVFLVLLGAGSASFLSGAVSLRYTDPEAT